MSGPPPTSVSGPGAADGRQGATVAALLALARRRLLEAPFAIDRREALLLLSRACGRSEAWVLAHPEEQLDPTRERRFTDWLERRLVGEPVAYLLGEREFWGRRFAVDRRVLIPRPESEHLIELALSLPLPERARALDVGTGSGCLAATLALERPRWRVVASDRSPAALALARRNLDCHGLDTRVSLVTSDLLASFASQAVGRFDLVVANLPYVDPADAPSLSNEITGFEPPSALFSAEGGLAHYRRLLDGWSRGSGKGHLAIEIGAGQLEALVTLVSHTPRLRVVEVRSDLAGHPRSVLITRQAAR